MSPARLLNKITPTTPEDGKKHRDYLALVIPGLFALCISLLIHVCGFIWIQATTSARVTDHEKRIGALEYLSARMHIDYVPRAEHEDRERERAKTEVMRDQRLERMDSKIDRLLEKQGR